jgi:hypothetical protein
MDLLPVLAAEIITSIVVNPGFGRLLVIEPFATIWPEARLSTRVARRVRSFAKCSGLDGIVNVRVCESLSVKLPSNTNWCWNQGEHALAVASMTS